MKVILTSSALVLSATLAVVSMQASAENFVGGDETNVARLIPNANAWTVLVAEPFQTMDAVTHCVATGSADAKNPNMDGNDIYRFVLSIDDAQPAINGPCERTVAFDNGAIQSMEEVSSTCTFRQIGPGNHTIRWLARKVAAAAANLTVDDNSMTFVCMNNLLDNDGEGDGGPD